MNEITYKDILIQLIKRLDFTDRELKTLIMKMFQKQADIVAVNSVIANINKFGIARCNQQDFINAALILGLFDELDVTVIKNKDKDIEIIRKDFSHELEEIKQNKIIRNSIKPKNTYKIIRSYIEKENDIIYICYEYIDMGEKNIIRIKADISDNQDEK